VISGTGGQPGISVDDLESFECPSRPVPSEQTRIKEVKVKVLRLPST